MSLWRQLTRGLHVPGNRKAADREIADEVGHYLEEAMAVFIARGLTHDEAPGRTSGTGWHDGSSRT